jgi:uncharacterized protein (TIGR03067 family)
VAYRVALRARKTAARRQAKELQGVEMAAMQSDDDETGRDLQLSLQEELQHLPVKYRSPLVLCYLEGRTNEEAARQLRCPVGTLKTRLSRGREMLRKRLARRGVALSAGALAAVLSPPAAPAVSPALVDTAIKAACMFAAGQATGTGALSANAVALTKGVLKAMLWTKLKVVVAVLLAVGLLGTGAGWLTLRSLAADPGAIKTEAVAFVRPDPVERPKDDTKVKAEVEKLQGTWNVVALETADMKMPENAVKGSKIVVKKDMFITISMGATYKGTFKIDVSGTPKTLDLTFTEGPEKGKTNLGIYELDGETWKICLNVTGKDRPKEFIAKAGSGFVLETLRREKEEKDAEALKKEMAALEGEWAMVSGEISGQPLPEAFVKTGKRTAKGNETSVAIGGQVFLKATYTIDPTKKPKAIDYTMTDGPSKGKTQYGIYEVDGDTVRFCFASPGKERPTQFATKAGDEQTLSVWKKVKP